MKATVVLTKREAGGNVEITLSNGDLFRITFWDKDKHITISTVEGSMSILPSVSNEVRIITNPNT